MARLEFENGTERDEMFRRIGEKNRVGRKHNHQPRGRAREKRRAGLKNGQEVNYARFAKKLRRFHDLVAAYWRGEIDCYPAPPRYRR